MGKSNLKILSLFVLVMGGFLGAQNTAHAGIMSSLTQGCTSPVAQGACLAKLCGSPVGLTGCKKYCKTDAEIIANHKNCATAAGLIKSEPVNTGGETAPLSNTKCKSLFNTAKKTEGCAHSESSFCGEHKEACGGVKGVSDWCSAESTCS